MTATTDGAPRTRMWIPRTNPAVYKALVALQRASSEGVSPDLAELVRIRVSQINGCAYCLHMHLSDAWASGLDPTTVGMVAVWRESPHLFSDRQRAALDLAECVTRLGERGVPGDVFDRAAAVFDDEQLGQIMAVIVMINAWNRLAIAGDYPVGLDERVLR
ncbi:carboxymuconolactone decarboxylase family protein [Gordonia sp. LSe1-13]|uniref:Carboxymuconolactone decarboxylase family protein n=1 Tax=Gordonia sesuvii TaxID=3116777 RepID=A0ABU7M7F5_9ACTN|nr:carboxymuconolactone decarboxylase family protein [Gordonia sp. LSe1-13]